MSKLHEIIAVEQGLAGTARKINEETVNTFKKKDEHFTAFATDVTHFAEEDAKLNTHEEKAMITTVAERLSYTVGPNVRAWDVYLQRQATNQVAVADILLDDVVWAEKVPAEVLLGLETRLTELRAVYDAIPTLAPGPAWELDKARGKHVYRSPLPDTTFRTRRTIKPIELSPATKEHPAQVQAVQEDIPIAKITKHHWSSMMSSADKSTLLERLDKLIRAVKRARQRANSTEVVQRKFAANLFKYLHEGIV